MAAARGGNVTIANAVGNGVADDKAVYAYVPDLIRYYLGEEPILPNVETYLLWDPDQRAAVLDRLDELVVKPVAASGGYGLVIGPAATDAELAECRAAHRGRPPRLHRPGGRLPVAAPDARRRPPRGPPRRPPAVRRHRRARRGHPRRAHPRRAPQGSLVVNSSQGGGSKDTWVLAPVPAERRPEPATGRTPDAGAAR